MINIKNITKTYNKKLVLDDVSAEIKKGKITSLVGANGAGKSTLLGIIARFIKQDTGDIFLENNALDKYKNSEIAIKVAVLKQANNLNIRLTVRELVAFGRYPHNKGRLTNADNQKIDEALKWLSLEDMQHKYIDQLSGGQRQRAFIAMTVAQDTDYIFLDEPLNNLDMKHSKDIMVTLRKLVDKLNKTIIIVLHDINFASCYSDEIIAMKEGKIVLKGAPKEIMCECAIKNVFDVNCQIIDAHGNKICIYQ
ncbi:MAG: ATP-binding cassette domain-containing protein [Erysipelotrichales bacterium]|nr:ATP-binding cassette domain-containing protein [Erysipelotrichales bacterium]